MTDMSREKERALTRQRLAEWNKFTEENPLHRTEERINALTKDYSTKKLLSDVVSETSDAYDATSMELIERSPALHRAFTSTECTSPLKVISSTGANAAMLRPGNGCISLDHSFCALIVLTNGNSSFVLHAASAEDSFIKDLCSIREQLGGDVKAKIYIRGLGPQQLIEDTEALQKYTQLLEQVVGSPHLIETHTIPNVTPNYLVTSDGAVAPLTMRLRGSLQHTHLPAHETFKDAHSRQSCTAKKQGSLVILDELPGHSIKSPEHCHMIQTSGAHTIQPLSK